MDTFEIILQTAEEIAKEQSCWQGGLKDFVALSSSVSQHLTVKELRGYHNFWCGSTFDTDSGKLCFYIDPDCRDKIRKRRLMVFRKQEVEDVG